ncbi:hypothetical protein ACWDTB_35805, partial [Streptomyces sp. NPDC003487]
MDTGEYGAPERALGEGALRERALGEGALREGALGEGALRERALGEGALREGALGEGVLRERAPRRRGRVLRALLAALITTAVVVPLSGAARPQIPAPP